MKTLVSRTIVLLVLALFVAAHASAQTEAWNQEKVMVLASQLEGCPLGICATPCARARVGEPAAEDPRCTRSPTSCV